MRILIVGAGAIGGYFGARLAEAGRDVTFLVRPRRAEQLAGGLFVRSSKGDVHIPAPQLVTEASSSELKARPFDLILLSCKAFDLDGAMDSFAPAVGPGSMVLPLSWETIRGGRRSRSRTMVEPDTPMSSTCPAAHGGVRSSGRVRATAAPSSCSSSSSSSASGPISTL